MTGEDVKAQLETNPFVPLRFHLVSGKTIDVVSSGEAWMLRNTVMILQGTDRDPERAGRYDVVSLRNIERVEQFGQPAADARKT